MTDFQEVEAKFEASSDAVERLVHLSGFGDFSLVERDHTHQDDRYFDSGDARLKANEASLRVRRVGSRAFLTFKGERRSVSTLDGHIVSRLEDEIEMENPSLDDVEVLAITPEPSPLRRVRDIVGNEALLPTARIETVRDTLVFRDVNAAEIELAIDRCRATRVLDGREREFVEVEAELKTGDAPALLRAISLLQETVTGLHPSTTTKLERALGD